MSHSYGLRQMLDKISRLFKNRKEFESNAERTILVVDDNEVDRKIIQTTLQKLGYRVLIAKDGHIGFEISKTEKPDVILSDCRMPRVTGTEMCKKLKEDVETKNIPVIFLTSIDTPKNVIDCFELDAHNFMCKPINTKLLTSQIRSVLEEHFPS
jgi:CheY-like chemotaxis protein